MNWLKEMFENKGITKEASITDASQEFTKKVKASGWIDGIMGIDEPALAKEAEAKMEAELAVKDEQILKEAAYDAFETMDETLKRDFARDAAILSEYQLAEWLAEYRARAEGVPFPENASELKEKAKKDVASDRKGCEKELIKLVGQSTLLDWQKNFAKFTEEGTPKQPKESDLYQPQLKSVNDDLSKGAKVDEYALTDEQHAKTTLGLGRDEHERTDVTAQPGETKNETLGKVAEDAHTKVSVPPTPCVDCGKTTTEGYKWGKGLHCPSCQEEWAITSLGSVKQAALVRDPDVELKVGTLITLARSIMAKDGTILPLGSKWQIKGIDGFHYNITDERNTYTISSHDTPKFDKIASQKEIENHATKEQIITKLAEVNSPWAIRVDKEGKEVIALVAPENTNTKESDETKKDDLNK